MASFCHKPHVVTAFRSGVMDQKGGPETVPSGAFRYFLQKLSLFLPDFLTERGRYGPRYVCKAWRPKIGVEGEDHLFC